MKQFNWGYRTYTICQVIQMTTGSSWNKDGVLYGLTSVTTNNQILINFTYSDRCDCTWWVTWWVIVTHHHHQSELVGDVAVPVSARQAVLFWALRSPEARPRLNWRRSSSTVLSQVCLGRPGHRLQFLGAGDMQACRAREWSWDLSISASFTKVKWGA